MKAENQAKLQFITRFMKLSLIITLILLFSSISFSRPDYPRYAKIDLDGIFVDVVQKSFMAPQGLRSLKKLTSSIYKIADDKELKGIILNVGSTSLSAASTQEVRRALAYAKQKGKNIVTYAESMSGFLYCLTTISNEIYMPPSGSLEILGVSLELSFFKDTLDLVGITADFIHVGEYKSAPESFTRNSASKYSETEMNSLVDGVFEQYIGEIVQNRKLKKSKVESLIDTGYFSAKEAKENKLIDGVMYYDELIKALNDKHDDEIDIIKNYNSVNYNKVADRKLDNIFNMFQNKNQHIDKKSDRIALIFVQGTIMSGKNAEDIFSGSSYTGSETICEALKKAREEKLVKAIVIRIDSPGGSALASDIIWHEIRTTIKEKPVYISMSSMAASGGYYIASAGNHIFCENLTLTGSIGVFGGKFNIKGLYDKIGIKKQFFSKGKNSKMYSDYSNFSTSEREIVKNSMLNVYKDFLDRVATGRKMDIKKVEKIAKGRVYLGKQALEIGLVDGIGGLDDSIKRAAKDKKLKDNKYKIWILPEPKSIFELLKESIGSTKISNYEYLLSIFNPKLLNIIKLIKEEASVCHLPYVVKIN